MAALWFKNAQEAQQKPKPQPQSQPQSAAVTFNAWDSTGRQHAVNKTPTIRSGGSSVMGAAASAQTTRQVAPRNNAQSNNVFRGQSRPQTMGGQPKKSGFGSAPVSANTHFDICSVVADVFRRTDRETVSSCPARSIKICRELCRSSSSSSASSKVLTRMKTMRTRHLTRSCLSSVRLRFLFAFLFSFSCLLAWSEHSILTKHSRGLTGLPGNVILLFWKGFGRYRRPAGQQAQP